MHDYDRTAAANYGKEGTRLRAIAAELDQMQERIRELADEVPLKPEYLKRLPPEFRRIYDAKKVLKDLETAAVKIGSTVGEIRGGATVIEAYDDPH